MTTTELNILPPERKNVLKTEILLIRSRKIVVVVSVALLAVAASLFVVSWMLDRALATEKQNLIEIQQTSGSETASLDENIRNLNTRLSRIDALEKKFFRWTPVIDILLQALPVGISVQSLEIKPDTSAIVLRGTASTRDDLIALQERITASNDFTDPSSPITNLLQRENIQFDMSFSLTQQ